MCDCHASSAVPWNRSPETGGGGAEGDGDAGGELGGGDKGSRVIAQMEKAGRPYRYS